jgi:probable blue pigment (indigoidine) exporter
MRRPTPPQQTTTDTALSALAPLVWGTTYLVTTQFLPPDRPLLSGLLRTLPAGLALLLITRALPRPRWWPRIAALGLLNVGAFNVLLFAAAYRLPGGLAATLTSTQPLIVAGLGLALLGERPSRGRLAWGALGAGGVSLMVLRGNAAFDLLGVAAALAAAASMGAGIVLTKRWGRPPKAGILAFTGWQLTVGGLFVLPFEAIFEGVPPRLDAAAVGGYVWLAVVGTLLAYILWFRGVGRLPVGAVSFLTLLSPVTATILGWAALGQPLTVLQSVGFLVAMASIVGAQTPPCPARWRPRVPSPRSRLFTR